MWAVLWAGIFALLPLSIHNYANCTTVNIRNFSEMNNSSDPKHIARSWRDLASGAQLVAAGHGVGCTIFNNTSKEPLTPFYPDWLKTWRCSNVGFPHHSVQSRLFKKHTKHCCGIFHSFGVALGYYNAMEESDINCAYPRCPAATFESDSQFFCERCLVAPYCSHSCQIKWVLDIGGFNH